MALGNWEGTFVSRLVSRSHYIPGRL